MIFDGPIAGPPDRTKPAPPGPHPIVEWQVVYLHEQTQVIRDIAIPRYSQPPLKTQWNGEMYRRQFMNPERLTVTYVRYAEDQK